MTDRRAFIAGLATAPALIATPVVAAPLPDPLDLMAAAILERLRHHGAEVVLEPHGIQVYYPCPGTGDRPYQDSEYLHGFTDGAMRELGSRLPRLVPGLIDAMKRQLAA